MKTFTEISEEIDPYEMTGVAPKTSGLGATHGFYISHDPKIAAGTPRIHQGHLETLKDWIIMNHTHLHRIWHSDVLDSQDHLDGIAKM